MGGSIAKAATASELYHGAALAFRMAEMDELHHADAVGPGWSMYKEHTIHGDVASEHIVRLFDTSEALAIELSTFVDNGLNSGKTVLVVATAAHWAAALDHLHAVGAPIAEAIGDGRLLVLDAAETLASFMGAGSPDPVLFENTVGSLVRRLTAATGEIHVYGEMVDLLAATGDFRAAHELEELWNRLGAECPYTLLCGYTAVHFGHPRSTSALELICRSHTCVQMSAPGQLSNYLITKALGNAGSARSA